MSTKPVKDSKSADSPKKAKKSSTGSPMIDALIDETARLPIVDDLLSSSKPAKKQASPDKKSIWMKNPLDYDL